jgi:hypothetical protein
MSHEIPFLLFNERVIFYKRHIIIMYVNLKK